MIFVCLLLFSFIMGYGSYVKACKCVLYDRHCYMNCKLGSIGWEISTDWAWFWRCDAYDRAAPEQYCDNEWPTWCSEFDLYMDDDCTDYSATLEKYKQEDREFEAENECENPTR